MSSFELTKGFSKLIDPDTMTESIPSHLISALDAILATQKLALFLCTRATVYPLVNPGALVQIFVKNGH